MATTSLTYYSTTSGFGVTCHRAQDRRAFKPDYAGKLNFYLSAIDDHPCHPDDQPSIGLILCRGKNEVVVEYALRDMTKPLGVSEYQLTEALPENLRGSLPTVEELETELGEFPEDEADD